MCLLNFNRVVFDSTPVYTQFYGRAHDPEVCDQIDQNLWDNQCNYRLMKYSMIPLLLTGFAV